MNRTVRLAESFPGSTEIAVYRPKNKEPHFIIIGAAISDLDITKVTEYMYECDWTDRMSKGWITPALYCDDFLKDMQKWKSFAEWEEGVYRGNSDQPNITTDLHGTKEQAEGVCELLLKEGFGGERIHFPIRTWVEPNTIVKYHRPKKRGELLNKLKEGITCEIVTSNVEITTILLQGWLQFNDFTVKPSPNEGWSLFEPLTK